MARIIRSVKAALNIKIGYGGSGGGSSTWYVYHHI
jgi:hypothetical protein